MRIRIRIILLLLFLGVSYVSSGKKKVELYVNLGVNHINLKDQKISSYSFHDELFSTTIGGHIFSDKWYQLYELEYVGGRMIHSFHNNTINPYSELKYLRFQANEAWGFRLTKKEASLQVYVGSGFYQKVRASVFNGGDDAFSQKMNFWVFGQNILCLVRREWNTIDLRFQCNLSLWNFSSEPEWNAYYNYDKNEFVFHGLTDWVYSQDLSLGWKISDCITIPIGLKLEFGNSHNEMSEKYLMKQIYIGCRF
ncbi:hypothetical protein K5X82_09705 [Halosquirtibacter xylanolyticus]|uniref:hypothetical protein n=1 Tax=Halosquirtibacter xylanolyticus TaxID=3374599 RepID=UPI003747A6F1|nr:hypothetical protein K5X82_09705 [Prolixibacteraceae bacterium]